MSTTTERITEIETEIAEITVAMSHIRKGGQSYMMTTATGAGTSRTVTMADYDTLKKHKNELQAELNTLQSTTARSVRLSSAW